MNSGIQRSGEAVTISGGMTLENAPVLLAQGTAALMAGEGIFDLAEVNEVDSSGLAVLFGWQRVAQSQGKTIRIANPPENLIKLAQVYGVVELLPLS